MANGQAVKLKHEVARAKHAASSARAWGKGQAVAAKRWANAKLREERTVRAMDTGMGIVGAHGTAVVQGQIHREMVKRDKLWLARVIGYGSGLGGAALAMTAKGRSRAAVSGGLALTGMSIAQLTIDTFQVDLVPGMNG